MAPILYWHDNAVIWKNSDKMAGNLGLNESFCHRHGTNNGVGLKSFIRILKL